MRLILCDRDEGFERGSLLDLLARRQDRRSRGVERGIGHRLDRHRVVVEQPRLVHHVGTGQGIQYLIDLDIARVHLPECSVG